MPPKSAKKQNPEDMLIRIIRVAEILAKGNGEPSPVSIGDVQSSESHSEWRVKKKKKTQR